MSRPDETDTLRPLDLVVALLVIPLAAAGCPGAVEDPARFRTTPETCDRADQLILASRCANVACHESSKPAAGLDLVSAGLARRLLDAQSEQCDRPLIDRVAPTESFLLKKLSPEVRCGARMPRARPPLDEDEVACVADWIRRVVEGPPPDGGGTATDGGGTATDDAGTATDDGGTATDDGEAGGDGQ